MTTGDSEVLATVGASPMRRVFGVGILAGAGLLMIYVAFAAPPAPGWLAFLLFMGGLTLWLSQKMWRATETMLELTETELRDQTGERLTLIEDIVNLDRGFFAFKPSNGFLIKTRNPGPNVWRPGLWWRMGRRIGVGGMTPGRQTKFMSEILAAKIAYSMSSK